MNICPKCQSQHIEEHHEHKHTLGIVCVCVECDSTWIHGNETQTFSDGEGRRAMQRQIERDEFTRAFNTGDFL